MMKNASIAFRCPSCEKICRTTAIVGGRFRCSCGVERTVRNPDTVDDAAGLHAAAARLSDVSRIDLPSAHSVLLGLTRLQDVVPTRRDALAADLGAVVPGAVVKPQSSVPRPALIGQTLTASRPRSAVPRFAQITAAFVVGVGALFWLASGVDLPAESNERWTDSERIALGDATLNDADELVEVRGRDAASIVRRYCRVERCYPEAVVSPTWLEPGSKLGMFRTEPDGPRTAILIIRESATEWTTGDGANPIEVMVEPEVPPGTAEQRLKT